VAVLGHVFDNLHHSLLGQVLHEHIRRRATTTWVRVRLGHQPLSP
jgi:hypothetical protein